MFVKLYQEKALQITFIICEVGLPDLPWPDVFVIGDLIIDVELQIRSREGFTRHAAYSQP